MKFATLFTLSLFSMLLSFCKANYYGQCDLDRKTFQFTTSGGAYYSAIPCESVGPTPDSHLTHGKARYEGR